MGPDPHISTFLITKNPKTNQFLVGGSRAVTIGGPGGPMGAPWAPMGPHGASWGPQGAPWGPMGDPGGPMGAHGACWGQICPQDFGGPPWGRPWLAVLPEKENRARNIRGPLGPPWGPMEPQGAPGGIPEAFQTLWDPKRISISQNGAIWI